MGNRSIWVVAAFLDLLLTMALCVPFKADYQVYTKGEIYKVVIKSIPNFGNGSMFFNKEGDVDFMKVSSSIGNSYRPGDTIELKWLPEFKHHYLFANQNPIPTWIGLLTILLFCFCAFILYALRKVPPSANSF